MSASNDEVSGLGSVAIAPRQASSHTSAAVPRSMQTLCGGGLLVAMIWAFWPFGNPTPGVSKPVPQINVASAAPARKPLDPAAFRTPLWVIPPPPPALSAPPPPPPPLKLQLIAIVGPDAGHTERSALIYDPDTDKLLTVREGDTLASRKIERITELCVHIRDGAGERVLALRPESTGGAP